jgi:hypothetical protein
MEYLTLKNVILIAIVVAVVYYLYNDREDFADKHHGHHAHHAHHGHKGHHEKHHAHHNATGTKPEAQVAPQPPKWNRLNGVDFWGFDLYQTSGATIDDCEKACSQDPFCTHLAWYPDRSNTCYHKGLNLAGNLQTKYISGFKRVDGTYNKRLSNDLSGFDIPGISGRQAPTIEDCEATCTNTPNCQNFTYGVDNKACYVKQPGNVEATTITSIKP